MHTDDIHCREPLSLINLTLGFMFNEAINDVAWPGSVQQLKFKDGSNQAIVDDVVWLDWRCLISTRLGLFWPG